MKQILILLALFTTFGAAVRAELLSATLRADGLTCSMCSLSVHKALAGLDFVAGVQANIADTTFTVTFRPDRPVSFDRLAGAVRAAGFSVGLLRATTASRPQEIRDDFT
jgi:copper chaperone CopZ